MKRRWKVPLFVLVALLLLVGGYAVYVFVMAGQLRTIEPHFAGTCAPVPGVPGPEDITFDPVTGEAYVSSDDRRATLAGRSVPGAIFAYDPARPGAPPRNLTPDAGPSFHPHGIALRVTPDGRRLLFVVNHPRSSLFGDAPGRGPAHTIEIFERAGDGPLVHRRTIHGELLISPNDIAPVADDRFYVTNDHGSEPGLGRTLEDFLRLRRSNVVYFDGQRFRVVAEDLRIANGVAVSQDGARVFVASVSGFEVALFRRDAATGALTRTGEVELDTAPDNIEIDAAGDLWIGAHPKLLSFISHARDQEERSPSEVVRVHPDGRGGFAVSEVFLSEGDDVSGSSVAARRGEHLLIGSVFDPHFLHCRMAPAGGGQVRPDGGPLRP